MILDADVTWQFDQGREICAWQITLVKASTGQILAESSSQKCICKTQCRWSMSGEICLLPELSLVLVCCPQSDGTFRAFRQYELLGKAASDSQCSKDLSLSPCGSTVVGVELNVPGLEHWHIPPSSSIIEEAVSAPKTLQPLSLGEITPVDWGVAGKAWHPLQSACIYAISSRSCSVHLIDAKTNECVQYWTQDELHGPATPSDLAQVAYTSPADDNCEDEYVDYELSWSRDGSELAVVSSTSARCAAWCSVLHFSDSLA